jgi:GT2 family glycosyltransferase
MALEAIASIENQYAKEVEEGIFEIILADNQSTDGSLEAFNTYKKKSRIKTLFIVDNGGNIGFAAGNNKGLPLAKGRYVLFLNPDTIVYERTLSYLIDFLDAHPDAGACSCKVITARGTIDEASHRGFPTPWNAFTHFSGLEKLFPRSRLFAGYTRGWEDMEKVHTIPAIVGAFMMVRREVGEKIGWWDEEYFFYGEDLQFCYNIWKAGYKIYYVPQVSILHYGGVSSGIKKHTAQITTANIETKKRVQNHRFEAMRIFFRKNYSKKYPSFVRWVVHKGIDQLHKRQMSKLQVDNK